MTTILDHSARQVWDTCKRRWYWTYPMSLDTGRSDAMERGRMAHAGAAKYSQTHDLQEALNVIVAERPEGMLPQEEATFKELEKATKELLAGYVRTFPDTDLKVHAVELPLAMELAPGYWYVGIVDGDITAESLRLAHEIKTTAQLPVDWVAKFQIDAQTVGYVKLMRANDIPAVGAMLSLLRATKYPEYVRDVVIFPPWLLEEWEKEIRQIMAEIEFRMSKLPEWGYDTAFPKNTDACFKYNQACPFRKLCTESPENRELMLKEGFFKKREPREAAILEKALALREARNQADHV